MKQIFNELRHHSNLRDSDMWQRQNAHMGEIIHRLEALPGQHTLSVKVTKVIAYRIAAQICRGKSYRSAAEYLQIVEDNQPFICKLALDANEPRPCWIDLEKNWKCFFRSTTF